MAEFRNKEDNKRRRDAVDVRNRSRNTDCPDRPKPNHIQPSQGPLSSLKAAIKRTKTNFHSEQRRERRRPEITILSAAPLDNNNRVPGDSQAFSAPRTPPLQVSWSADSHAVTQVLKEKTEEDCAVKPVAAPRRLNCKATSSTHTSTATTNTAGKRPPKPPRPSLPKSLNKTSQENQATAPTESNCSRSVSVFWNNTSSTETSLETAFNAIQRPVPLPRIKSKKPPIAAEENFTLVKLDENSDNTSNGHVSTNKYLEELLEVFSVEKGDFLNQYCEIAENADEMSTTNSLRARIQAFENQAEEASEPVKPVPRTRKPSIRPPVASKPSVVIKPEFNSDIYENVSSSPPTPAPKPPKKPVGQSVKAELDAILSKGPAPTRTRPSMLLRDNSIHDEDFAKGPPMPPVKPRKEPLKPNLNINNHNSTALPEYDYADDTSKSFEATPFREYEYVDKISIAEDPIANQYEPVDNTCMDNSSQDPVETTAREYEYVEYRSSPDLTRQYDCVANDYVDKTSNNFPFKPQPSLDNYTGSRQSVTRRPTTIIVPSKTASFSDGFQENPPALPVQKAVGALNAPMTNRHSIASFPPQVSPAAAPEPTLPPRRLTTSKTLPPRPPSVNSGSGRPLPPHMQAAGRSNSAPWDTPPKPQALKPQRQGPVLPPRPNPGHCLYNNYTLQVPHAIAACDYNGGSGELSFQKNEVLLLLNDGDPSTFECQVGDKVGTVHKSRVKVITPLSSSDVTPSQGGSSNGLTVQALHDFNPENPGELGLKAGDVVTMVEQLDSEWYQGTCRGSTGYFPINYVKVLTDIPQLPERKPKKPSASISGPRCVARFDFEGEQGDELSFSEGDVIQLKAYVGEDWARGQVGAITGIFPLNFVEIIEDLPPAPSQQQTQPNKIALPGMTNSSQAGVAHPAKASQSGVEWAVALYDFSGNTGDLSFVQGDRILIIQHLDEDWSSGRLNGREGMFPRAFVEIQTVGQASSTNHQNGAAGGAAGGVKARALFDFASDCEEELSLKFRDIITNLESVDDEWYLGDLRGKRALVPKNYVQIM